MKSILVAFVTLFSLSSIARDMVITCESQSLEGLNNANIAATTITLNEYTKKFEGQVVIELKKSGFNNVRFEEHLFIDGTYKIIPAGVFGPKQVIFLKYVNPKSTNVKDVNLVVNHPNKRSSYVMGEDNYVYRTKCVEVQTTL